MSLEDSFKLVTAVLVSLGGGGAIVFGLSNWLGRVWANRLMEKERAKHEHDLEALKNKFTQEIERYRTRANLSIAYLERYQTRQFEVYGMLWSALYDLKLLADQLWISATKDNLSRFVLQLKNTSDEIHRLALFIEEPHYKELKDILNSFYQFEIGKYKLIELRTKEDLDNNIEITDVGRQIEVNYDIKQKYVNLIEKIKESLFTHLRHPNVDELNKI